MYCQNTVNVTEFCSDLLFHFEFTYWYYFVIHSSKYHGGSVSKYFDAIRKEIYIRDEELDDVNGPTYGNVSNDVNGPTYSSISNDVNVPTYSSISNDVNVPTYSSISNDVNGTNKNVSNDVNGVIFKNVYR